MVVNKRQEGECLVWFFKQSTYPMPLVAGRSKRLCFKL